MFTITNTDEPKNEFGLTKYLATIEPNDGEQYRAAMNNKHTIMFLKTYVLYYQDNEN